MKTRPTGGFDMHPAGRATAAVMSWTSIWEAKKQVERDKRDHGRWVRRRALLSSRTSNYFCCTLPLLEGGPRLYCTDLGGWDGTGGAQVAHGRLVIKGGRTWVRASQPNGGGGRQTCLSNKESEREKRMRQTDRQTDRQREYACGEEPGLLTGLIRFVARRQSRRDAW